MAQRRMMSLRITDTDTFLDMPITSRYLYCEYCLRADDDGFIGSPKKILKMVGCSDDDYKLLLLKNFIIPFDSGICVIKHWRIHNYIRSDRYTETVYKKEKSQLEINDGTYDLKEIQDGVIPYVIPRGYTG